MKLSFCKFIFFNSLLLFVSSCSDHPKSTLAESAQEQQLEDSQIINIMMAVDKGKSAAAQEQQLEDSQIINIMMTVDKGEIAAAQEATKKKVSPAVDLYAKYLIQQHQKNLEELTHLAKQLGLEPKESVISTSLNTTGKHDLKTLGALQDKAFDKAFIDAMVKGHQEGLQLIDTKLFPQTKNPQLKVFVEKFRKMVSDHLEKGLKIQKTL